ncbi:hypothetical protein Tco_0127745 [Tanacetum coccineum]
MMDALEVVNLRVSYQVDVRSRESSEFYSRHHDAQKDRVAVRAEIEVLRRERLAYEQESMETRQALAMSETYNRALEARKMAPKRATRSTPVTTTPAPIATPTTSVTNAQLQAMIDQDVTATLAARDVTPPKITTQRNTTWEGGGDRDDDGVMGVVMNMVVDGGEAAAVWVEWGGDGAREGEWVWGSNRSEDGECFWSSPEKLRRKSFPAAARRWWPEKSPEMEEGRWPDNRERERVIKRVVISFLMYVMTCTRPDIAFAVGKLSMYTSNPGYTDGSWISNTEDNSSISGWVFMLGGGEAEWLRNLILKFPLWSKPIAPISIRCDSAATLAKALNQMYNGKSRHLGVKHSMIRELITNRVIEYVRSQQNIVDHLTKGLARDLVLKSSKGIGLKWIQNKVTSILNDEFLASKDYVTSKRDWVKPEILKNVGKAIATLPETFKPHRANIVLQ